MNNKQNNISKSHAWLLASRPKTLLAAVVPVIVGSALAISEDKFFLPYSIVALACALLIQIGTNFNNDLYDYLKGADNEQRKGPLRVLVSGLISVKEMKAGIIIVFGLAFLLGLYLVYSVDIIVLIIGVISIIAGLAYTAGPYPLAYHGLGDIFVFLFFGIVATAGTYYLHTQNFNLISFLVAIPVGALTTNILVVNNYRDIEEDRSAGKNTLAVIIGKNLTRFQFIFLLVVCYAIIILLFIQYNFTLWIFLPYMTLPLAYYIVRMIFVLNGKDLNRTLELTAKFSGLYGVLFAIGIIL